MVSIPARHVGKKDVAYSSLEHIGRSIWGLRYSRANLLAMLSAYFDDSERKGFTVVAGWIASVEAWDRFEIDWKLFLASYKVPYFHMKEFAHSVGPYKKWKESRYIRARFLREAWNVIKPQIHGGFISGVPDILFNRMNRIYELREAVPNEYALAGRACIEWADELAKGEGTEYRCIFDDAGTGNKCALIKAADLHPKLYNPIFEHSRDIPHKKSGVRKGFVHLQAADFIAYECQKHISDHALIRSGQKVPRVPLLFFGEKKPHPRTYLWTEERIIRFCERFGIKRREQSC